MATAEAAETTWREAIRRFDADGVAGKLRRHAYALVLKAICSQIDRLPTCESIRPTAGGGFIL